MLIKKEHTVKCPGCGKTMQRELWNIADTRLFPEVRREIMDGHFNVVICRGCSTKFYVEVPFVYQEPDRNVVITVLPESLGDKATALRNILEQKQKETGLSDKTNAITVTGINKLVNLLKQAWDD
ncbi:MAG: CpXC domain-containing protein [Candidatus Muiribacteriaceae bacterium]